MTNHPYAQAQIGLIGLISPISPISMPSLSLCLPPRFLQNEPTDPPCYDTPPHRDSSRQFPIFHECTKNRLPILPTLRPPSITAPRPYVFMFYSPRAKQTHQTPFPQP